MTAFVAGKLTLVAVALTAAQSWLVPCLLHRHPCLPDREQKSLRFLPEMRAR
jgi:hypothetical protein